MDISAYAHKRYSTKSFIPGRPLPADKIQAIKALLRLSPSSVNSQPWHFILAGTDEGKARIAKSTQGLYEFNLQKILKASLVILFCARTHLDDTYLERLTQQEWDDGRLADEKAKQTQHSTRKMFVDFHKTERKDVSEWTARQTYLNLGTFLLGVSTLGLDAVPIEGFDNTVLNQEFDLTAQGLTSLALVAVGYHAEDDFNATLPKSRLPEQEIITEI